jgi:short-subunit dehydrogenase
MQRTPTGAFRERYGPWALIAGASDGVGASVARRLGERGVDVVLVSRRKGLLDEVAATVATDTRTLALDLSAPDAWTELAGATNDLEVGLVVYNAGAVAPTHFVDESVDAWRAVLARNCEMVLCAAHHYGRMMVQRGHGGIVFVSSNAAWSGTAGHAVYGATKAFQLVLGESLWAEFRASGVDVLTMVLGAVDTPSFRRMLGGRDVGNAASSDDIALEMLDNLANGPTIPAGPSPYGAMDRRAAVETRSERVAAHFT